MKHTKKLLIQAENVLLALDNLIESTSNININDESLLDDLNASREALADGIQRLTPRRINE